MSVPLVLEYETVLVRHAGQLGITVDDAMAVVDYPCLVGHRQEIDFLWRPSLADPHDEFVLELAVAARCRAIVTHNVRDFEGARRHALEVLTPARFLARLEESS